jgi:hypothetical protein
LIRLKHLGLAFTGSQELTSAMWAGRVRACGDRDGRGSGEAEADTLPAPDVVLGRDNLVRAAPGEASGVVMAILSRDAHDCGLCAGEAHRCVLWEAHGGLATGAELR